MHHRFEPKQHRFHYNVFMFYIDLDEINFLTKKLFLVSRNKFNAFNFRDRDHLQLPKENPDKKNNTKQHITDYLKQNGVELQNGKIFLLTNCALPFSAERLAMALSKRCYTNLLMFKNIILKLKIEVT